MKNSTSYIWGFIGKFAPQLISLVTTFILARFLSPNDFGIIGILGIFVSVSQTLLEGGLGGSLIKEKQISTVDCSTIFVFNIIMSSVLYLIIYFCAPLIEAYYQIVGLAKICRILCLVFVINSWGLITQTILFRELKFKALMTSSIISVSAGSIISIIAASYLKLGVYSLVLLQLTQNIVYVLLNWIISKYQYYFQFSFSSLKRLFSFGFYTTITGILESGYENILPVLFGKYLGVSQAGYLSQAKRIENASVFSLSATINVVAFPILVKLKDSIKEFKNESYSILKNLTLLILPIFLSVAIFSKEIILVVFGYKWIDASPYLMVLMWTGCVVVIESAIRNFIKSLGEVRLLLKVTIIKRILAILLMLICVLWQPEKLIYAFFVGCILGYISNVICYVKIIDDNILSYLFKSCKLIIIPVSYYLLLLVLFYYITNALVLKISLWILISSIYYFYGLQIFGIRIMSSLIFKLKKHHKYS